MKKASYVVLVTTMFFFFEGTQAFAINVARSGAPVLGVADDISGTNATTVFTSGLPEAINDGISLTPNDPYDLFGADNGVDTWAGAAGTTAEFDFVGVTWDIPQYDVTQVTIQQYAAFDGGWWGPNSELPGDPLDPGHLTAPTLQVTSDGVTWSDLATTNDYVTALAGTVRGTAPGNGSVTPVATFDFPEQDGIRGIRLIGNGGGGAAGAADDNGWTSAIEFTVEGLPGVYADVDTTTGELVMTSSPGIAGNIVGYDITSSLGALEPNGWTSIANNYDAGNPGPDQVDADDQWTEFPTSSASIAEAELNDPPGDGAQFGPGTSMSLGNVWIPNPFGEDVQVDLLFADGTQTSVAILYDGASVDNTVLFGDFDLDGDVDGADWPTVRDNLVSAVPGLTAVEAYYQGDLNTDGFVDSQDFRLFNAAFIADQGAQAFEQWIAAGQPIPEPSASVLFLIGVATCAGHRWRKRGCKTEVVSLRYIMGASAAVISSVVGMMAISSAAFGANVALVGEPIIGLTDDIAGNGDFSLNCCSPDTFEMNDGISGTAGEIQNQFGDGSSAAEGNGTTTWAGGFDFGGPEDQAIQDKEFDYVGVTWGAPFRAVSQVRIQHYLFDDAGWWGPTDTVQTTGTVLDPSHLSVPDVQITNDGTTWTTIASTNDYVAALTGSTLPGLFPTSVVAPWATFDFAPQDNVLGIRLIGNAAAAGNDDNGFIALVELEVDGIPEPSASVLFFFGAAAFSGQWWRKRGSKTGVVMNRQTVKDSRIKILALAFSVAGLLLISSDDAKAGVVNIATDGTGILGIADDIAGNGPFMFTVDGAPDIAEMNDGISGTAGELINVTGGGSTAALGNGAATWAGGSGADALAKEFDFVGVTWDTPVSDVKQVRIQHYLHPDAAWWGPADEQKVPGGLLFAEDLEAPNLQVTTDGTSWTTVPTTNDYVSVLTDVAVGGFFPSSVVAPWATFDFAEQDGIVGARLIGNSAALGNGDENGFIALIEFEVGAEVPGLTLEINRDAGTATLFNDTATPYDINFFSITSDLGVLDIGFTGLSDGGQLPSGVGPGLGWEKHGELSPNHLGEVFLGGSSEVALGDGPYSLGSIYTGSDLNDESSVAFTFETADGDFFEGTVVFVDGLPGDFNGDGSVDTADYVVWLGGLGSNFTAADYDTWKSNFGTTSGNAATNENVAVPEPSGASLILLLGGLIIFRARRTIQASFPKSLPCACVLASVVLAGVAQMGSAAVTRDRDYRLGDDALELGANGTTVGSNNVSPPGNGLTLDSTGGATNGGAGNGNNLDFQDISVNGNPEYVDTSGRPGAEPNEQGAQFDGTGDYLSTNISLNGPGWMWNNENNFPPGASTEYPLNYANIFARGIQLWANPDVPALTAGNRQDLVIDTPQHGIFISSTGTWGLQYAFNSIDSSVEVASTLDPNGWVHVMEVSGFDRPVTGDLGASGALLVNGVAVAARNQFYGFDTSGLGIGADPDGANPYTGILDDVSLFLWGDNSDQTNGGAGPNGQNYGTFFMGEDNEWIANRLSALGVTDRADVNLDGSVDSADISAFVPNWKSQNVVDGVQIGDWNSRQLGDLNYDGIVDLGDVAILHGGLVAAGVSGGFPLGLLNAVPEPSSLLLAVVCSLSWFGLRVRRLMK